MLRYFAGHAGEQVIFLSRPDEVHGSYLKVVKDRVCKAYHIELVELDNGVGKAHVRFYLANKSPTEITNAAMRFHESFAAIPRSKVGAVQLDALRDAARAAFTKSGPDRPVEIATVRDELNAIYAQTSRKPDVR